MRAYLIYIIINKLWIKLLRLLSIVISMNSNNIVNKSASYTQEYPHIVNCLITLSTVLTCTLIISKNFPNYNMTKLNYPQINRDVDNLINIVENVN